jgi:hypothetical protein
MFGGRATGSMREPEQVKNVNIGSQIEDITADIQHYSF